MCSRLPGCLVLDGCTVGPKYHTPSAPAPAAYKELTPEDMKNTDGWKVAQPKDDALHGEWWEIFNDPQLNALEDQVNISNQNIAAAFASFMAARAMVKEARSQYFPTVTTDPSITNQRQSSGQSMAAAAERVRRRTRRSQNIRFRLMRRGCQICGDACGIQVRANVAAAQASAADLENTRLTMQSELAVDYFRLRGQDALKELLDSTVVAYSQSLESDARAI